MIGGIDIRLPTKAGKSSLEIAVRTIRQMWPLAVFENGLTGDKYERFSQIPFGDIEELFVYRDSAAEKEWDDEGAVEGVQNLMIHLILDEEMLTVVVDERDAFMEKVIGAIESGLRDEVHCIAAVRGAA
jgi:pheromone shutdown protein TraB